VSAHVRHSANELAWSGTFAAGTAPRFSAKKSNTCTSPHQSDVSDDPPVIPLPAALRRDGGSFACAPPETTPETTPETIPETTGVVCPRRAVV